MNRTGTRLGVLALAAAAAVAFSTWTPRRIAAEEISLPGEEAPAEESWSGAGPARASQPSGRIMEGGGVLGLLWRGGGVMFFIALCSIVGVAFAIERAVALRRSVHIVEGLSDETLAVYRRDGADEAIRSLSAKPVSEARVLAAALARSGTGYREMEFAVAQAGTRLLNRMQKNVRILGILSNVAVAVSGWAALTTGRRWGTILSVGDSATWGARRFRSEANGLIHTSSPAAPGRGRVAPSVLVAPPLGPRRGCPNQVAMRVWSSAHTSTS